MWLVASCSGVDHHIVLRLFGRSIRESASVLHLQVGAGHAMSLSHCAFAYPHPVALAYRQHAVVQRIVGHSSTDLPAVDFNRQFVGDWGFGFCSISAGRKQLNLKLDNSVCCRTSCLANMRRHAPAPQQLWSPFFLGAASILPAVSLHPAPRLCSCRREGWCLRPSARAAWGRWGYRVWLYYVPLQAIDAPMAV